MGAAYGLLVLVFQHGIGAGLLGFQETDTIEAWVPLFLFSVLFGLSMDYQVFLLSRIRERYDETRDTTDAVTFGVALHRRIITGAALIIVAVFPGFARGDLIMFQQMGFGVAVALLIDATVIRSVVLPSVMKLLGDVELVPAELARVAAAARGRRTVAPGRESRRAERCGVRRKSTPTNPLVPSPREARGTHGLMTRRTRQVGTLVLTAAADRVPRLEGRARDDARRPRGHEPRVVRARRGDHGRSPFRCSRCAGAGCSRRTASRSACRWLTRAYFVAYTAGQVLPTSLGGDAVRVVETTRRHPGRATVVTGTVLLERGLGGAATVALGALGFLLSIGEYDVSAYLWLEGVFVFGTLVLGFLFFARSARPLLRRTQPLARARSPRPSRCARFYESVHHYRGRPRLLGKVFARHVRRAGGAHPRDLGRGEGRRHRARSAHLLRLRARCSSSSCSSRSR